MYKDKCEHNYEGLCTKGVSSTGFCKANCSHYEKPKPTFYKCATGRIVTKEDVKLAYEIAFGEVPDEFWLYDWLNCHSYTKPICASEITVEEFIKCDLMLEAIKAYRIEHCCSLKEAYDAVIKMKAEMRVKEARDK